MEKYSHIHPVHSLFAYNKNDQSCLKNLFVVSFHLIRKSSYAKNETTDVLSHLTSVSKSPNVENFHIFHPVHPLFVSNTKNDLSWLKNPFMASFQLISMSSYAKNKQQMCRVTQHQCNVAKCGKYSQIHPVHWLFVYYKQVSLLGEYVKISTFGDFYTDLEWFNTSVVCSWHKRAS